MSIGGGVYGQGLHGRTIDVVPQIDESKRKRKSKKDRDTMLSGILSASRSPAWIAYVLEPSSPSGEQKLKKKRMTSMEMDSLVSSIATDPDFRTMVAKEMRDTTTFVEELKMNERVLRAYGKDATAFTTLRVVSLLGKQLAGIKVPSTSLHYTLQSRCQIPLDRFRFKEASQVRSFVRDVRASFDRLHKARFLHADVKRDNMIFCSSSKGRKYRLIDWGASASVDAIRKGYLGGTYVRPKNSISPLAWFAYGAEPVAQWITLGRAALLHTRAFTYPEFRQFASDALTIANDKIDKLVEETGEDAGTSVEQPKARALAIDRHWKSFDLFNLGFIFAEIAYTTRGGRKERARLMRLAYKMVSM